MAAMEAIHRAIRLIHEAALVPECWNEAAAAIAEALDGRRATLFSQVNGGHVQAAFFSYRDDHEALLQAARTDGIAPPLPDAAAIGVNSACGEWLRACRRE